MNAPHTRAAEGLDRWAFTVAEVERMVEAGVLPRDARIEVIGGGNRSAVTQSGMARVDQGCLNFRWVKHCPEGYLVAPETGLRLDEHTYLEPDFVVFERRVDLATLRGPEVLLAVEIADNSLDYDLRRKPLVYAKFGVHELWVIDAKRRVVHVHVRPGPDGYAATTIHRAAERLQPTAAPVDFAVALNDLAPR